MKVVDSSALIKHIAKEENLEKVEEHLKEGCVTMGLATEETANALIKKVLSGETSAETATEPISRLPKIVRNAPQKELLSEACNNCTHTQAPKQTNTQCLRTHVCSCFGYAHKSSLHEDFKFLLQIFNPSSLLLTKIKLK